MRVSACRIDKINNCCELGFIEMESGRLLFLSIKGVKDAAITAEQKEESGIIISWLSNIVNPSYRIIASPMQECLEIAQLISSKLSISFQVSKNLIFNKYHHYSAKDKLETIEFIDIPDFHNLSDVQSLVKYISSKMNSAIFVLEREEFECLHLECKFRENTTMTLHIYDIENPNRASEEISKIQNIMDSAFLTKGFAALSNSFPEIRENLESLQLQVGRVPLQASKIAKNVKKPFFSQQIAFAEKLNDLSLSVEAISSRLQDTKDSILLLKSLSDLYILSEVPEGMIVIKGFYFQPFSNSWKISIKNPTPHDFRKVDIYVAETTSIICSFHMIQGLSTVSKVISPPDSNYYGRNLVAVSGNQPISQTFTVSPYLIRIRKMQSTQGYVNIELKNYSDSTSKDIVFVTNTSVNPLYAHRSPLGYGETMHFEVLSKLVQNAEVFAVESNTKVSNSLLIR